MRKSCVLAVGFISLGASTQHAVAAKMTCTQKQMECIGLIAYWLSQGLPSGGIGRTCTNWYKQCQEDGSWGPASKGTYDPKRGPGSPKARFGGNMSGPGRTPGMSGSSGRPAPGASKPGGATFGSAMSGGTSNSTPAARGALPTPGPAFGTNQFSGGKK